MKIDLCVVSYNTAPLLDRFLRTLTPGSGVAPQWRLYVADNGSEDQSHEVIKSWESSIYHADFNENIGYSAACNQLASYGESPIIGLLNADVWMTNDDVERIVSIFDANPDIHILGPKQRDENGLITHAGIFGTNEAPKHRGWHEPDRNDSLYRDRRDAVTVSGAAYFIRRHVWDTLTLCPIYRKEVLKNSEAVIGAFLPTPHYY